MENLDVKFAWEFEGINARLVAEVELYCRLVCEGWHSFRLLLSPQDETGRTFDFVKGQNFNPKACPMCGNAAGLTGDMLGFIRKEAAKQHGPDVVEFHQEQPKREELWGRLAPWTDPDILASAKFYEVDILEMFTEHGEDIDKLAERFGASEGCPSKAWEDIIPRLVWAYGSEETLSELYLDRLKSSPSDRFEELQHGWIKNFFRRPTWVSAEELSLWWRELGWTSGIAETRYLLRELMKMHRPSLDRFGRQQVTYIVERDGLYQLKTIRLRNT